MAATIASGVLWLRSLSLSGLGFLALDVVALVADAANGDALGVLLSAGLAGLVLTKVSACSRSAAS